MDDILKEFITETKEGLENIDHDLISYEAAPDNRPLLDKIFRSIHTIKGGSGFLNLGKVESVAHYAENILSKIRDGKLKLVSATMNVLLESIDALKAIITSLESTETEGDADYKGLVVKLKTIVEEVDAAPASAAASAASAQKEVDALVKNIKASVAAEGKKAADAQPAETAKKAEVQEKPPAEKAASAHAETVAHGDAQQKGKADDSKSVAKHEATVGESNIRVQVNLLDKLVNLVGELVLARNQIVQSAGKLEDSTLNSVTQGLSMITTELQENMLKTRMQPIGNIFNKFPRIVRDLAQSFQKEITLKTQGQDTELDKAILEGISDPLTHIIRNSIDHGIESPKERIQKGKNPSGTLLIHAYHEGGNVIILISDDGAGINPEKIKRKALEKGVLTQKELDTMSQRDIINIVFRPGFSTAEKVTNISGRGVGMDVVKTNVEKIGGSIDIQSEVDRGTTMKLKIPLTLAIVQALIVWVDEHRFAIPQVNLIELVRLEGVEQMRQISNVHGLKVYRLRDKLLPLVDLRAVLNLPSKEKKQAENDIVNIVVLAAAETRFGIIVDKIHDTEEIVVKPVSKHLKHLECYSGATIMGDGKAVLILDAIGLARAFEMEIEGAGKKLPVGGNGSSAEMMEANEMLIFSISKKEQLAIPVPLVSRIEKIEPSKIEKFGNSEVLQYYGKLLPIIRLENYLNITKPEKEQEEFFVIVLQMEKIIGFVVADIIDAVDVGKQIDTTAIIQDGILGTTLANGRTTLIIDTYKIIERAHPEWFQKTRISANIGKKKEDVLLLLVEDSPFFQNMERSYLDSAGYRSIQAGDGVEAMEKLASNAFDVVITDIEMPRMNGFQLAQNIRKDARYNNLPIVAVTSLVGDADREKAKQSGIDEYLVKLNRDDLLHSLEALLAKGRSAGDVGMGAQKRAAEAEERRRAVEDRRNVHPEYSVGPGERGLSDRRKENNYLVATFYLGKEFCGIEALQIQEILRYQEVTPIPLSSAHIRGLINLRGRILTVIETRSKLEIPNSLWSAYPMSLVVFTEEEPVSLIVDDIGDILEIDKRRFEPPPKTFKGFDSRYIKGVFKLDGKLLTMLNVETLIQ